MKDKPFKILLDTDHDRKLQALHELLDLPKAQIIRELINWRYEMQSQNRPTCANGKPCMVAHLHMFQAKLATEVKEVTDETRPLLVHPPRPATAANA